MGFLTEFRAGVGERASSFIQPPTETIEEAEKLTHLVTEEITEADRSEYIKKQADNAWFCAIMPSVSTCAAGFSDWDRGKGIYAATTKNGIMADLSNLPEEELDLIIRIKALEEACRKNIITLGPSSDEDKKQENTGSTDSKPSSLDGLSPKRPNRKSERMFAFHRTMYRATMLVATGAALLEIIQMSYGNPKHFVLYGVDSLIALLAIRYKNDLPKRNRDSSLDRFKGYN